MKKILLLLVTLMVGLVAQATVSTRIRVQGFSRTIGSQTQCLGAIQSMWGGEQIGPNQGSSYTFSNETVAGVILNGTLSFQETTSMSDVVTASSFTVTDRKSVV